MMGSVGEHLKGETPFLDRIKAHNALHAEAIRRCAEAAPLWRKIVARLGWPEQLHRWQASNQCRFWD
jgi:hypothetical protein